MNGWTGPAVTFGTLGGLLLLGGVILDRSAAAFGLMAATIAIGGFVGRALAVLGGRDEDQVQRATMYGGLVGLVAAVTVVLIDAIAG